MTEARPAMQPARRKRIVIASAVLILVGVAWYAFRPELLFVNQSVNESFPAAAARGPSDPGSSMAVASGTFRGLAHETEGTATIHQLASGMRVLRLTGFKTSNGPDLHVYLVSANDAPDDATVTKAGFVDLGSLKGNVGDQNYDVPADLDLSKYGAVTIWCARFGVNFGTAPIQRSSQTAAQTVALSSGAFHGVAHDTQGTATIYQIGDKRALRLTGFTTSNGPDLRVYLIPVADAMDSDIVKTSGHVELGALKGNIGDQNYDVPADIDLAKYRAVTIWCARFGVNFGTAPLGAG